jgi:hypothetical protein
VDILEWKMVEFGCCIDGITSDICPSVFTFFRKMGLLDYLQRSLELILPLKDAELRRGGPSLLRTMRSCKTCSLEAMIFRAGHDVNLKRKKVCMRENYRCRSLCHAKK